MEPQLRWPSVRGIDYKMMHALKPKKSSPQIQDNMSHGCKERFILAVIHRWECLKEFLQDLVYREVARSYCQSGYQYMGRCEAAGEVLVG